MGVGVLFEGECVGRGVFALVALHFGNCHVHALHFRREHPRLCWRAFSLAVGAGCANAPSASHLLCQNIISCAIMTLIQENRFNPVLESQRFDSTGFVFN
jgi:hypothetical protein